MHPISLIMLLVGLSQVLLAILDYQVVRNFQPSDPMYGVKLAYIKFGKLQAKVGAALIVLAAIVQALSVVFAP